MIKSLIELNEQISVEELGGKGFSLGILINNDFNVPNGFIITSTVFLDFLNHNHLMEQIGGQVLEINLENAGELSSDIKELIFAGEIPENITFETEKFLNELNAQFVSVRSSAVSEDSLKASFAGLHDTFLNIKSEPSLVLEGVKKCWASLFNERAMLYRIKKELPLLEGMAVVLQEMIPAEVSGVTFTVHPSKEKSLLVEASYGLGDMLVSGRITPDDFVVDRKTVEIIDRRIGNKNKMSLCRSGKVEVVEVERELAERQTLPDERIKEIAQTCLKVEQIFNYPQDVEWAVYNDKLWLLQSRAITVAVK